MFQRPQVRKQLLTLRFKDITHQSGQLKITEMIIFNIFSKINTVGTFFLNLFLCTISYEKYSTCKNLGYVYGKRFV